MLKLVWRERTSRVWPRLCWNIPLHGARDLEVRLTKSFASTAASHLIGAMLVKIPERTALSSVAVWPWKKQHISTCLSRVHVLFSGFSHVVWSQYYCYVGDSLCRGLQIMFPSSLTLQSLRGKRNKITVHTLWLRGRQTGNWASTLSP